jgi:hypothetical protein
VYLAPGPKLSLQIVDRDSNEHGATVSFRVWVGHEIAFDETGHDAVISLSAEAFEVLSHVEGVEVI